MRCIAAQRGGENLARNSETSSTESASGTSNDKPNKIMSFTIPTDIATFEFVRNSVIHAMVLIRASSSQRERIRTSIFRSVPAAKLCAACCAAALFRPMAPGVYGAIQFCGRFSSARICLLAQLGGQHQVLDNSQAMNMTNMRNCCYDVRGAVTPSCAAFPMRCSRPLTSKRITR